MTAAMWRVSLRKELRALLPMWAVCMLGVLVVAAWGDRFLRPFGMVLYGLGSFAIGAQAIGHEYGNRTLVLLLSHPVDRRRLLLAKVLVQLPLLAVLGIVAFTTLPPRSLPAESLRSGLLILLGALCLAPTLTLLSRSPLAGVVFTAGILAGLEAENVIGGSLMVCALGALVALVGWRQFTRLEALEGGGRDLQLPRFAVASAGDGRNPPLMRNPIVRLIAKELRLQQLTFVAAGMCLASLLVLIVRRRFDYDVVVPVSMLCAAALPMLTGALASAEERRMGTLQWQQLMPMRTGGQFAVKVAVVFALAIGLSMSLMALSIRLVDFETRYEDWVYGALGIVLVTSASLYVSSLNSSGIRAAMAAVPSMVIAAVAFGYFSNWVFGHLVSLYAAAPHWRPYLEWMFGKPSRELLLAGVAAIGFSVVLLRFAHGNHASSERPLENIRRQAGWIAGAMVGAWVVLVLGRVL